MVTAGIEAYGSPAGLQRPAKSDGQDLQRPAQRRPARGQTSLAFALIVVVLVFGLGGLAVSAGTRYVVTRSAPVPDVTGLTGIGATYVLDDHGFRWRSDSEPSSTVPWGKVTRTDPPAGTNLRLGQPVTFYTSTGPEDQQP
ncbi:MAG: PASTA domain-containing protein [Solirubrobacteraceae bacterium]